MVQCRPTMSKNDNFFDIFVSLHVFYSLCRQHSAFLSVISGVFHVSVVKIHFLFDYHFIVRNRCGKLSQPNNSSARRFDFPVNFLLFLTIHFSQCTRVV